MGSRTGKGLAGAAELLAGDVPAIGRSRRNRRRPRTCQVCGAAFAGRADAQTCSATCRKRRQRASSDRT